MKYIDADKLRAVIERQKKEASQLTGACASQIAAAAYNKIEAYDKILSILDTIQEPEVDLEDEMEKFGERWPYPASFDGYDKDWVDELAEECAKHFYELGKKDMKAKMMEGAVEGVVCYGSKGAYIETDFLGEYDTDVYGNPGDKVKIIIVKEEEQ